MLVSIKADLYELGAPDVSGFPGVDTDEARLIVAAFGKDGPPVAAKRLTVKERQFPVAVELTVDDLAFPLTKASAFCGLLLLLYCVDVVVAVYVRTSAYGRRRASDLCLCKRLLGQCARIVLSLSLPKRLARVGSTIDFSPGFQCVPVRCRNVLAAVDDGLVDDLPYDRTFRSLIC